MIAIAGDLVDSDKTNSDIAIALASKLMKIAQYYYVTANHEAWIGQKFSVVEDKLLDETVQILHDWVILLERDGQTKQLV